LSQKLLFLLFQYPPLFLKVVPPPLKFFKLDNLAEIGLRQTFNLLIQALSTLPQILSARLQLLRQPIICPSSFKGLPDDFWMSNDFTEITPDQIIELLSWGIT
jgi:hypothetical protein